VQIGFFRGRNGAGVLLLKQFADTAGGIVIEPHCEHGARELLA
jgi:hypothetical protein